jgi:hypothetical protein
VKNLLFILLLAACGGSSTPAPATPNKPHEETAEQKRSREYRALLAEEPKFPYVVERTKTFQVAHDCAQGPYRIDGTTLQVPNGKSVVYICAAHLLSGRERFVMNDERNPSSEGQHFGYSKPGNERCSATATEITQAGDAGATSSSTTSTPTSTGSHGVTALATSEKLADSDVVITAEGECPKGTSRLTVIESSTMSMTARGFHVDIWFPEPNDLRGATFVLQQLRPDPAITREQWTKIEADRHAWWTRLDAFRKAHDDMFVHTSNTGQAATPPPPPRVETQPPKPSVHAEWVPGYHHHDGTTWVWIAGFWRVPDEDVKKELTTVAPTAPPPVRDESAARITVIAHDVVWTDGHWQWDGAGWVWVGGAWRLPPEQGVTWQAPTWRPRGATFVFVPGGWARRR